MKISKMDVEALQLTIDTVARIEAIAEKTGESPANVFAWFVGKLIHSVAYESTARGIIVSNAVGQALAEHYSAERQGRTVEAGGKGGIDA